MTQVKILLLLLGGVFALVYTSYFILILFEGDRPSKLARPGKFAGFFSLLLGLIALTAWLYFLMSGWRSFMLRPWTLAPHVAIQLTCSISLVLAGIALLQRRPRGPLLFLISMGFVVFNALFSIGTYGSMKHPLLMNGILIVLLVAGVNLMGVAYAWEHFVLHLDEEVEEKENPLDV